MHEGSLDVTADALVGITKADHGSREMIVRRLPDGERLSASDHLHAMESSPAMPTEDLPDAVWAPTALPRALDGPLTFYYGLLHGDLAFLMMFKQPERFRLAYSPCGGGTEPAWNPAWDYVLQLDDAAPGTTYAWDLCLAVKPYQGREDILTEVRKYLST